MSGALGAFGGGVAKGILRHSKKGLNFFKAANNSNAVISRYRKMHNVGADKEVHHWLIKNNGKVAKLLRRVMGKKADYIINNPINLNPIKEGIHQQIHGNNSDLEKFGFIKRWLYGTPRWAKAAEISAVGGASAEALDNDCNKCKN